MYKKLKTSFWENVFNILDFYHQNRIVNFLKPLQIDKVIDVGSHKGEFLSYILKLKNVKKNVNKTGYDKSKLKFIVGDVMETIQNNIPDKIALLRLDTDFYDSTKCELEYLFPKLSEGGILIVDDYGRWQGSRKATDEYIKNNNIKIFLNQIYPSGSVIGIKQKMTFK